MKRILILLLLVCATLPVLAQRHVVRLRPWSQGPLTYGDFRGRPGGEADGSFADFSFGFRQVLDTVDHIALPRLKAWGSMRPYASWMLPGSRNDVRLRYHQQQFDLVERARQELQRGLNDGYYDPQSLFEAADERLFQRLALLDSLSLHGTDTAALSRWQAYADSAFGPLGPAADTLPQLGLGWMGEFHFFTGIRSFRGELDDCFRPSIDFSMLIVALYSHHMFAFDFGFGIAPLRDSVFTTDSYFYTDRTATDLRLLLEYGYRLIDRRRWSLTPFVAGGLHIIDQSEEDDVFHVLTGTYGGGILLQWRYAMSFDALDGARVGRGDFDLSARLTLLHSSFSEIVGHPSGWGVYLQFGLGFGYGSYRHRR